MCPFLLLIRPPVFRSVCLSKFIEYQLLKVSCLTCLFEKIYIKIKALMVQRMRQLNIPTCSPLNTAALQRVHLCSLSSDTMCVVAK